MTLVTSNMDDSRCITNSTSNLAAGGRLKYQRITAVAATRLTLSIVLCLLIVDLSQAAKDGHGGGGSGSSHQSPSDVNAVGGDDNESSTAEDSVSTMLDQVVGQIYLIIVGIVLGTWAMYMICTCRANRIQKEAFQQKVELMKQEVVLDCENTSHKNNHNHDDIDNSAPFDGASSKQQSTPAPVNGRYESTYMKPWETFKSGLYLNFSTRHDGGKGWLIGGTGMDNDGSFTITEGLLSESGKAYWVEKCDDETMGRRGRGASSLSVTSGTFHLPSMRDCSNTCFNGSWHAENGTRGIYWSFRLASDDVKDEVFSDVDLEHDD